MKRYIERQLFRQCVIRESEQSNSACITLAIDDCVCVCVF